MFRFLPGLIFTASLLLTGTATEAAPTVKGQKIAGAFQGPVEIWDTPSHKQAAGNYVHGEPDGRWTYWDETGTKVVEITYQSGTFSGHVIMWHNAASGPEYRGKLKSRGSFKDGDWAGSVMTYYPDGHVRSERVYTDGVVTAATAYQPDGRQITSDEAMKVAFSDEQADNRFVDALDEYIRKTAG